MATNDASGTKVRADLPGPPYPVGAPPPTNSRNRRSDLGSLRELPDDLLQRILCLLIPSHDCIGSPYSVHECVLSFGPQLKGLKAAGLTCHTLNLLVSDILAPSNAPVEFRQEGSRCDYARSMRLLNARIGQADGPDSETYAQREAEIVKHCRRMYDIDHLPEEISMRQDSNQTHRTRAQPIKPCIPMSAQINLAFGMKDLSDLDDSKIEKYWHRGKTHAFYIGAVSEGCELPRFLSHYPEGLVSLELPQIFPEDLDLAALGASLGKCTSLKHLAIQDCDAGLAAAITPIKSLLSLKLSQPAFSGPTWEDQFRFVPRSLQSLWVGAPEGQNLMALMKLLPEFSALRELRLTRSNMPRDDEWKALVDILSAPAAFTGLVSLEIQGVPDGAGKELQKWAIRLNRLALPEARLKDEDQSSLLQALCATNHLSELELKLDANGRLAARSITSLGKWLANPKCSLRSLVLEGKMDQASVQALASGIQSNRSLEIMALDIGGGRGDSDTSEGSDADSSSDDRPQPMQLIGQASGLAYQQSAEYAIAEQIAKNSKLRVFRLRAGRLSAAQVAAIAFKVMESKNLLELDLKGCAWNLTVNAQLKSVLETSNRTLLRVRLSDYSFEADLEPLLLRNQDEGPDAGSGAATH